MTYREFMKIYNECTKQTEEQYRRLAKHFGLSDSAFQILYYLRVNGGTGTLTELYRHLFVSKQTVYSSLQSLEKAGIVAQAETKGKEKPFTLTRTGIRLAQQTADKILAAEERIYKLFEDKETERYLRFERRFTDALIRETEIILHGS